MKDSSTLTYFYILVTTVTSHKQSNGRSGLGKFKVHNTETYQEESKGETVATAAWDREEERLGKGCVLCSAGQSPEVCALWVRWRLWKVSL